MSDTDLLSAAAPDVQVGTASASDAQGASAGNGPGDNGPGENGAAPRRRAGLSGMVLAELRQLAASLGITNTAGLRKGDLITAIKQRQDGGSAPVTSAVAETSAAPVSAGPSVSATVAAETVVAEPRVEDVVVREPRQRRRAASRPAGSPSQRDDAEPTADQPELTERAARGEQQDRGEQPVRERSDRQDRGDQARSEGREQSRRQSGDRDGGSGGRGRGEQNRDQGSRDQSRDRDQNRDQNRDRDQGPDDDEDGDGRGRRGRRFRDRRRNRGERRPDGMGSGGGETEVREDDVLLPVAGILDVLENYAFVRTSGYLSGPNDVYVSLSLVRKHGLRRGDAVTGAVRQQREGEQQRQKFNPMVRVDTVNGMDVETAKQRPEFTKLTPLYPNERLRLETEPHILTTRVIDLVMPIGKGQRALIVSPPKAGKTMILQAIANAITTNNPECHLMVVLVDERPEEVTDMQRSVKGEVIASTFDRPPSDHTTVSELAIERAKRLVEMGHDVVVLLDSITRLGRAYNLAAPASGRILSGGVDSTALFPPKRFLGAARNIENGGSLTIFATALVETGSAGDTVIFEEFKGTGNAELKLDRRIADKRVFPAIDIDPSGTRKEELLLSPDELAVTVKLRRVLAALESQQAIDLLLTQLRKTRTNIEFLMQVAKTTPGAGSDD